MNKKSIELLFIYSLMITVVKSYTYNYTNTG